MTLINVVTFVGVCATLILLWNSKDVKVWRIRHKEGQIHRIDHMLDMKYGLNRGSFRPLTELDKRRHRLYNQIEDLKERM